MASDMMTSQILIVYTVLNGYFPGQEQHNWFFQYVTKICAEISFGDTLPNW
jgi:hypothetical protein